MTTAKKLIERVIKGHDIVSVLSEATAKFKVGDKVQPKDKTTGQSPAKWRYKEATIIKLLPDNYYPYQAGYQIKTDANDTLKVPEDMIISISDKQRS